MMIHGFTKTTLLDYPGHVAATIFTGGCNLRCPFCHNGDLVINPESYPRIDENEIFAHFAKRSGILTGVCVSGGEPTLQTDLIPFLEKIRATGLLIKLDTNGTNPAVVKELIYRNLVDYIAMDIKAGRKNYSKACGIPDFNTVNIENSVNIIQNSSIDYEFRTTAVAGIHSLDDFADIAKWLKGNCKYFIQSFKEAETVLDKNCHAFDKEALERFLDVIKQDIPNASLRGID